MASAAVLWFGEFMSAVPLRNNKVAVSAVRTVTVLGATGSIGDSTMDLLRAARDRYQVEALTANTNVQGLAKLAREFGARFAAVADPDRLSELKDALAGTRTECGAGDSAIIEAAARPADWVMAAVSGAAGLKPALAAVDRGASVALANKECLVCAAGSRHHHRLRRTVPDMGQRRYRASDAGAGVETPELEHGTEDHHRFRVDDEQGA